MVGRQWPKSEIDSFRTLSFSSTPHLVDMLKDHIEFEDFDPTKTYDPGDIFLVMVHSYLDPVVREQFSDCKVIVDLCREAMMEDWNRVYYLLEPGHVIMYGSQCQTLYLCPTLCGIMKALKTQSKGETVTSQIEIIPVSFSCLLVEKIKYVIKW